MDAAGFGILLELNEGANDKGITFRLLKVTERVKQILEITRLNTVFEPALDPTSPRVLGDADHCVVCEYLLLASCTNSLNSFAFRSDTAQ
jgi:STAS domain-containing protein